MATVALDYVVRDRRGKSSRVIRSERREAEDLLEEFKEFQIGVAFDVLREEQRQGFDENPRRRIDNKFDRPVRSVRPFGKIEFFARVAQAEVLLNLYDAINRRQIVKTGAYQNSSVVMVNNRIIAKDRNQLVQFIEGRGVDRLRESDLIKFVNTAPYARRLENLGLRRGGLGKTTGGQRKRKSRKTGNFIIRPAGAYALAFSSIRRRFKGSASTLKFAFIPLDQSVAAEGRASSLRGKSYKFTGRKRSKPSRGLGRPYLYPSIQIAFSELGSLT